MGPKKKLSKKEKARLEAEQQEVLRQEQEKERQRKLEEERERKQKEREEAEKRQQREITENKVRRKQLKETVRYFGAISSVIEGIKGGYKVQKEWERFMRCDGLPDTQSPGDLRKYLQVWGGAIAARNEGARNWLLETNERTLLTQDQGVPNLSREFLRQLQGNFGDSYSQRIREVLQILVELDEGLEKEEEAISAERAADLRALKQQIRDFLSDFIDDFTYKILSHVTRDMESTKPGVAYHSYKSDIFKSEIFAILGDALSNQKDKFHDENRNIEIDFPLLDLQLSIPPTVKINNTALRGLWLNYDHFSDYCRSFQPPKPKRPPLDILQQTKKEWKKRKEILNSTLEETSKEASVEDFEVEKQQPRAVDVDKIYTEFEDELNKANRRAIGPVALNLSEFDVNLRKYRIISGVYAIDLFEYPHQDRRLNAGSFIRTIVEPNQLTQRGFYHPYRPPPPPPAGVRRLPEEIEAEMKLIESNLEKLSLITLQLPDTVLWFEPPIVCRWETAQESAEAEESSNGEIIKNETIKIDQNDLNSIDKLPVKELFDFDMCNIPNHLDIFGLMTDFVVPRLPNGYSIKLEYKKSKKSKPIFHYFSKNFGELEPKPKLIVKSLFQKTDPIIDNLIETGSPRPFDPEISFSKILKIKHAPVVRRRSSCFDAVEFKETSEGLVPSYMFSELIEDLDEIFYMQAGRIESKIEEISSNLSTPRPDGEINRKFSGIIIIRESEIPEIKTRDSEDDDEDADSGSEFDDTAGEGDASSTKFTRDSKEIGKWTTRDIHDTKFNEDKFSIQFRAGRLGFFGFAANRYSNMPYQTWEIKPDLKNLGAIFYSLTAAVISIEMLVTEEGFCITNLQGGTTETLNDLIGKIISLEEMKFTLRTSAVDIFPEEDAFCYTEGSCEKNFVMEMHLYNCISTLALSHNFSWSRWNLLSGSRTAVLLMREFVDGKKIPDHSTLLVTPLKTTVVDCTEVSASFSTIGIPGMEFYADLHQLSLAHSHPSNKEKRQAMDPVLRENVAQILMATRPLSFC